MTVLGDLKKSIGLSLALLVGSEGAAAQQAKSTAPTPSKDEIAACMVAQEKRLDVESDGGKIEYGAIIPGINMQVKNSIVRDAKNCDAKGLTPDYYANKRVREGGPAFCDKVQDQVADLKAMGVSIQVGAQIPGGGPIKPEIPLNAKACKIPVR